MALPEANADSKQGGALGVCLDALRDQACTELGRESLEAHDGSQARRIAVGTRNEGSVKLDLVRLKLDTVAEACESGSRIVDAPADAWKARRGRPAAPGSRRSGRARRVQV